MWTAERCTLITCGSAEKDLSTHSPPSQSLDLDCVFGLHVYADYYDLL